MNLGLHMRAEGLQRIVNRLTQWLLHENDRLNELESESKKYKITAEVEATKKEIIEYVNKKGGFNNLSPHELEILGFVRRGPDSSLFLRKSPRILPPLSEAKVGDELAERRRTCNTRLISLGCIPTKNN